MVLQHATSIVYKMLKHSPDATSRWQFWPKVLFWLSSDIHVYFPAISLWDRLLYFIFIQ